MLRFTALRGVRAHENVEHSQRRENVIYRDRSHIVELLLQLENKQQIMQDLKSVNYGIGIWRNIALSMARFTCIMTSQVFVKI